MGPSHVTGALADLRAVGYSQSDAVQRLLATANTSVPCGTNCHGRLDVAKAVGPPPAAGSAAPAAAAAPAVSPNTTASGSAGRASTPATSSACPSAPVTAGAVVPRVATGSPA